MSNGVPTVAVEAHLQAFAHELVVAAINLELHSPYSEEVQQNLHQLFAELRAILDSGLNRVDVEFGRTQLSVAHRPMLGASLQAKRLLTAAAERDVASISFGAKVDVNELLRFLMLFTSSADREVFGTPELATALEKAGIPNVHVTRGFEHSPQCSHSQPEAPAALTGYQELADCLQDSHVAASRGETIQLDRANGVVEQALAEMDREPSGLLSLAYYDDIDSFTVGHSVRVALLALQVARACGADEPMLLKAGTAALLHDIGKSRVPQSVLFKQGPLDDDEWRIMSMHPRLGAEILIEQPDIDPSAIGAAFCHHMADKGRGYPKPTLPFEPSGISKLVRVCDVFEALTSVRPYKAALTPVEAYAIMHRNPDDFDPKWLRFFVDAIGLYPLGTRLILSTGEYGTVIGHGGRRDQPRVKLSIDAYGNSLPDGAPTIIDVGSEIDGVTREVKSVVPRQRRSEAQPDDDEPKKGKMPCC